LWYALPLTMMTLVYSRISVVLWHSSHGPRFLSAKASPPATPSTAAAVHHNVDADADVSMSRSPVKCVVVPANDSPGESTHLDVDAPDVSGGNGGGRARMLRRLGFHRRQPARRQDRLTASPRCLTKVEASSDDTASGHDNAVELRSLTNAHDPTRRRVSSAVTTNAADQTALSARRKVIRLLIAVVVSFAVCVLPYHVRVLWQAFSDPPHDLTDWHLIMTPLTFVFYYLNSGLNPLLYAFLSNKFRTSLIDVLCGRCRATTQMPRATYDVGGHVTTTMNMRTARTASVC